MASRTSPGLRCLPGRRLHPREQGSERAGSGAFVPFVLIDRGSSPPRSGTRPRDPELKRLREWCWRPSCRLRPRAIPKLRVMPTRRGPESRRRRPVPRRCLRPSRYGPRDRSGRRAPGSWSNTVRVVRVSVTSSPSSTSHNSLVSAFIDSTSTTRRDRMVLSWTTSFRVPPEVPRASRPKTGQKKSPRWGALLQS